MTETKLITLSDPRSAAAEAYRTLRTNLMFSAVERHLSTISVASITDAEDKSVVLANLAVTFAQGGYKTIIVDTDLRRPVQHTIWDIKSGSGLTTMMLDDTALASPPLVQTSVKDLWVLPAGQLPPNPADILGSQRMNDIIGLLKARANYVLFDVPPVLAATDAALLSAKLDGILLTIRAGHSRRDHTARAKQALERVHVRILGSVLTNAPRENMGKY
ncbi:MAG: CpsD/CapB family tyrosine-protein kinase [Anaerolineae bacterium]